ncbi:MAG: CheR family methyltransferase [Bacteroidota bacterium]
MPELNDLLSPKSNNYPTRQQILRLKSVVDGQVPFTDISRYDVAFLVKSLQRRMADTRCCIFDEYFKLIEISLEEANLFVNSLQISYSEFFRNPLTYSVLERIVLPSMLQRQKEGKRNELRIWSAACAAGQEPYSLAILLEEISKHANRKRNYRIFATDQSELQVNEAQQGKYLAADLNNVTLKRVNNWFDKKGDTYVVKQKLKNNIDFSVFDLFDQKFSSPPASIFGEFDLVVCANLLFYYKNEDREKIIAKAGNCLAKDGYLVTGEVERDVLIKYDYKEVFMQSGIFRK